MTIGVVGLGSIGQRHVRNIRTLRGQQDKIIAYRSKETPVIDLQTGLSFCDAYRVTERQASSAHVYGVSSRWQPPECMFICNPTSKHWEWVTYGMCVRQHVFVEKPVVDVGPNERVDLSYVQARQHPECVVQVGYQWRFHPTLYTILTDLCDHAIGEVLSAHLVNHEHLPDAHPWEDYREGYAARRDLGGGVLACYSHEFDLARFLFGHPATVSACGGGSQTLDTDVEDTASVLWTYTDHHPAYVTFDLSFVGPKPERWMRIVGRDGSLTWDLIRQELTYNCPARSAPHEMTVHQYVERNDLYLAELQEFFACIDEGRQPRTSLEDGLAVSQLIGDARSSMALEGGSA